jgi:hypothetical protein
MKLRRSIYELMAKWMTLYKVLKNTTVLSKALLNTTLYVFRRARYNVAVNFSVSSRMLPYKASMARGSFLYTLSSSIPKERDREKSGDPAGHKYDMLFPYQHDVNECHSAPSVQPSKNTRAQYRHENVTFLKLFSSVSGHSFKYYRQKRHGRSIRIILC